MMASTTILLQQVQLHRPFECVSFGCLLLQEGSSLQTMLLLGIRDEDAQKETDFAEDGGGAAGQS